jgi:hypothetical protein
MRLDELLPEELSESLHRRKLITEFWDALDCEGDSGAATWEALDRVRERVRTALLQRPPDICLAESLTAEAALMIAGCWRS